ncbi:MAG: TraC family protein [Rickettsiaceae bacterium]|nr:TraC family protein [Rickettsiaceae bacterium]MCP5463336.1 TraC family protein [bacterium]
MLAKNIHPDFQRERLSPHFVYESFDAESGLFFNRGSVGFVLIANPMPGAELTAETEIADFIANSENLPNGASIQILLIASNNVKFLLDRWAGERKGEIYREMAKRRCDFLEKKAKEEGVVKDSHVLISVTVPDLGTDLIAMGQRIEALKSTFQSIGLWTQSVDDTLLLSILRKIWGRESFGGTTVNQYAKLSEQILPGDFSLYEENDIIHLKDDECFIALDAEDRPARWSLGLMDLFIGNEARKGEYIDTEYFIHVGIWMLPNQAMARARIFAKREALEKNIKSGIGKFFSDLSEELADIDGAVKALQDGERVVHIHTNVILKGKKEKVKLASKRYAGMMRRNGWNFIPTKYDHLAHVLTAMPMSMVEEERGLFKNNITGAGVALSIIGRGKQTVSGESKALMPFIGEYKGDLNAPGLLLTGRRGQLKFFSQFGADFTPHLATNTGNLGNPNVVIVGVAGSGKSVTMQEMMLSVLGVGGKVFVVDYGKSFEKLCHVLDGNYIEFDPSNPISINPFSGVPTGDDEVSSAARADFLASFPITLATMAAPKHGTTDLQQTNLEEALRKCWDEKGVDLQIDDIADWLLAQENNPVANDLGRMLFNYTKNGAYGGFFQGKAEVTLDADIVVIETDHLRNFPDLMAVVTQIMMTHINNKMAKGKTDKPSLLVFDEITKTLENPTALKFVSAVIRIVRKYKTSVVLASQLITDFHDLGKEAMSIFAGADFKLIMKQNPDTLTTMRSLPLFQSYVKDDERMRRMGSIESKKGEYGEFALWAPGINGDICQLRIDPFTLLLMTTNPTEKELIKNHRESGLSLAEAINTILAERGL